MTPQTTAIVPTLVLPELDRLPASLGKPDNKTRRGKLRQDRWGRKWEALARLFIDRYPPGSLIPYEEMDQCLQDLLSQFGVEYDPQLRRKWVRRISDAGLTPRLNIGSSSFRIDSDLRGCYRVSTPDRALLDAIVLPPIARQINSGCRQLRRMAASVALSEETPESKDYLQLEYRVTTSCMYLLKTVCDNMVDQSQLVKREVERAKMRQALPEHSEAFE